MSKIRINKIKVKNYRSFWEEQEFNFPDKSYRKPIAIIGYNNAGKTNLMNAIKYGLYESVRDDTFELKDFHDLKWGKPPIFEVEFESDMWMYDDKFPINTPWATKTSLNILWNSIEESENVTSIASWARNGPSMISIWNRKTSIKKHTSIFYINFHKIKDEILTKKGSWGGLKSFLSKHIDKLIKEDISMQWRKEKFKTDIENATSEVLEWTHQEWSELSEFINNIKSNYSHNLQDKSCEVNFSFPDYEDIFLQMMFKIWLNWSIENLIPIDHLGDGYVSMFVMAVIQAIAESNTQDQCLFLFEEPESFLHENHQEYFYKMVLCKLAKKHQVIYTTHSDKMIDFFDTKWIIRLEFDEGRKQTENRYNDINADKKEEFRDYNDYIQRIEPNLNKILFSKKVILVEWPNDVLVYKYAIEQKIKEKIASREDIEDKELYSQTYLNFENVVIIPHHGKTTARVLIELCKHFRVDFFVITDWDFNTDFRDKMDLEFEDIKSEPVWNKIKEQKGKRWQQLEEGTIKWMITNNKKLITISWENIHFNFPKLEKVIWYVDEDENPIIDKDSMWIWEKLKTLNTIPQELFPKILENFLELDKLENPSL